MNKHDFRIVFMGTPAFAVASLEELIQNGYNVVAVVTMPDKPSGRGQKLQYSDVKECALANNLPLLQPTNLKDPQFIEELRSYQADLQIVVAFRILPEIVWAMPRYGTFNLHAALLPQYRGAAPINWAIINGEKETGLTTFMLQQTVDTGEMILQEKVAIGEDETFGELYDRLKEIGKTLVTQTTDIIIESASKKVPVPTTIQPDVEMKPAPKIFKEMCEIDFSQTAEQIRNFVRGLCPNPCAWANITIANHFFERVKIYKVSVGSGLITIPCKDGVVSIDELQLPGKKRMHAKDVLNGLAH